MYQFEIFSKPVPQKQTQWGNGRGYDPSAKDKQAIIFQSRPYAPEEAFIGPAEMDIMFYLPIPVSTSKSQRRLMLDGTVLPIKRPDVDNLGYLIVNALKGLFYRDDSQIVDLKLHKRFADTPKTVIKICPL